MDTKLTSTLEAIQVAFAKVKRPRDEDLLHDNCRDDSDIASFYGGSHQHWSDLPRELIESANAALAFLSPVGFQYFLPAYMTWTLQNFRNKNSSSTDHTVYTLQGSDEFHLSKFELLDALQIQAIVAFLRYLKDNGKGLVDEEAVQSAFQKWTEREDAV